MAQLDLVGHVYGKLTVLAIDRVEMSGGNQRKYWNCQCECGARISVIHGNLRNGQPNKSCGCHQRRHGGSTPEKHGKSGTREHRIWKGIRKRCNNDKCSVYKDYGGRGIKVCKRWDSFLAFLTDMGPCPSKEHEIERREVDKDYCPENCYWVHGSRQNRNRRDSIMLTFQGETKSIHDWADQLGMPGKTLVSRYQRGWSHDRILTEPPRITKLTKLENWTQLSP